MKKLLAIIAIVFTLSFIACEKVKIVETPKTECEARYEQHIKLWDSLYKTGTVDTTNYIYLMKQFRLEYEQCKSN